MTSASEKQKKKTVFSSYELEESLIWKPEK